MEYVSSDRKLLPYGMMNFQADVLEVQNTVWYDENRGHPPGQLLLCR